MVAAVIAGAAVVATVVKHFGPLAMAEFSKLNRLESAAKDEKTHVKKADLVLGNPLPQVEIDNALQRAVSQIKTGPGPR